MTRSQAALLIGWLAFAPGALVLSGNVCAIPTAPGQLIDHPAPPDDFENPIPDTTDDASPAPAAALTNSGPAARPEDDPALAGPATGAPAQDTLGSFKGIPCLHGFASENAPHTRTTDVLCTDDSGQQRPFRLQFGHRQAVSSGILGETDGIRVDYRLSGGLNLQGIAGFPAVTSGDEFNTTRRMLGFSVDTGTLAQAWNLNAWLFNEQDNAQIDNNAIGGTLRYLRPRRALLVFLDYDANQEQLSAITASGAWKLAGKTTLGATFDIRNRAIHKRQKKHLQYSMASIDGWNWILPDDRINHYTSARTREVITRGLSLSHTFSQRLKVSGDVAMLNIMEDGLPGNPASPSALPSEHFYRLKITGQDLFIPGNSNKLNIRHQVTGSTRISTASFDTRHPINRLWHLNPRLQTEHRNNSIDKSGEWVATPAVKMEYRWKDSYGFQIEAGGKWSNRANSAADTDHLSYSVSLGYQANF